MKPADEIIRRVLDMPLEDQTALLRIIDSMPRRSRSQRDPEGLLAHLASDINFQDFKETRREMWGQTTR